MLCGELGGKSVDVVVVAVDGQQRTVVDRGGEYLRLLQRRGDQHDGVPPRAGRSRGHRVGQVARGGAGEYGEAQLAGCGQGHGDHAVLERVRGVTGVILDPEVTHAERGVEPIRLQKTS